MRRPAGLCTLAPGDRFEPVGRGHGRLLNDGLLSSDERRGMRITTCNAAWSISIIVNQNLRLMTSIEH